jgi:hypothetical protein
MGAEVAGRTHVISRNEDCQRAGRAIDREFDARMDTALQASRADAHHLHGGKRLRADLLFELHSAFSFPVVAIVCRRTRDVP